MNSKLTLAQELAGTNVALALVTCALAEIAPLRSLQQLEEALNTLPRDERDSAAVQAVLSALKQCSDLRLTESSRPTLTVVPKAPDQDGSGGA